MTSRETPKIIKRLNLMQYYYDESQSKFGKRFNLDQSYLSSILNGHRKMSGTMIREMAEQNIDIKWLLTGEGKMLISQEDNKMNALPEKEVSKKISELKDELIQALKQQVEQLKCALDEADKQILKLESLYGKHA